MKISRFALFAIVLAGLFAFPLPVSAAPNPAELRKLTKQASQLNDLYRGQIQSLEEVRIQAKKATDNSGDLEAQLAKAKAEVSAIAQSTYIAGPLDGVQLLAPGVDPTVALGQAANMTYLANERVSKVQSIQGLIDKSAEAKRTVAEKIDKLKKEIKTMQGKRRQIERLLAKYGFQQPGGSSGLTPRLIAVRAEIMRNFPMPYGVGCLRPGDPGEHGKGRACDFMMSSGGRAAAGADADRGDALAEWLIKNGPRIGVMYIIWKQRYYDIRSGGGWDPMSDRGGVTANHYDHVHVSVF
ncbi:coiled-coil domain-containing protein [Nonomuraea sp. CA-143628]|uniref:coiled-coil domain-containing protein n=1 Tax=Nonomuraea sp. CA-143628 TaxID=3239997 RepID=UPI003D8FC8D7